MIRQIQNTAWFDFTFYAFLYYYYFIIIQKVGRARLKSYQSKDPSHTITTQPTRFYHINVKYIWVSHANPYGDPMCIRY